MKIWIPSLKCFKLTAHCLIMISTLPVHGRDTTASAANTPLADKLLTPFPHVKITPEQRKIIEEKYKAGLFQKIEQIYLQNAPTEGIGWKVFSYVWLYLWSIYLLVAIAWWDGRLPDIEADAMGAWLVLLSSLFSMTSALMAISSKLQGYYLMTDTGFLAMEDKNAQFVRYDSLISVYLLNTPDVGAFASRPFLRIVNKNGVVVDMNVGLFCSEYIFKQFAKYVQQKAAEAKKKYLSSQEASKRITSYSVSVK